MKERNKRRKGFTLIELLVVIAIIALLISILLPSLSRAKEAAKAASCASYLKTFGTAFEMYSSSNNLGARSSGAYDYYRDGDVRKVGWVADVVNMKVGAPGKMLCPSNRWTINEKTADYMGATVTGAVNPKRWTSPPPVPILGPGAPVVKTAELWNNGYNTNYATTWQFSRGDPTALDGYGVNGDTADPSKCPLDGDGPMNTKHLDGANVSADRIAIMGDARQGDSSESYVTSDYATKMNAFADEQITQQGDFTAESYTDGMTVDYAAVTGDPGRKGHEFNDIMPLHSAKNDLGGYANILFADGHAASVYDVSGLNNDPDGFLGPYKNSSGAFEINDSAFKEIRTKMWYGRLRPKASGGGGSVE